jgi:hypothetical protein
VQGAQNDFDSQFLSLTPQLAVSENNAVALGEAPVAFFTWNSNLATAGIGFTTLGAIGGAIFVRHRAPGSLEYVDVTGDLTAGLIAQVDTTIAGVAATFAWTNTGTFGNGWQVIIVGDDGAGVTVDADWDAKTYTVHYKSGVSTQDDIAESLGDSGFFGITSDFDGGSSVLTSPTDDQTVTLSGGVDGSIAPLEEPVLYENNLFNGDPWTATYQLTGLAAHAADLGEHEYMISMELEGFLFAQVAIVRFQVGDPVELTDLATAYTGLLDALSPSTLDVGHAVTGTLSTTVITTDLTFADADAAKDMLMLFTSGALAGQVKRVGASTSGAGATLTLKTGYAFSRAPSNGDTFILVNR